MENKERPTDWQFNIGSILCVMGTVAVMLSYVQQLHPEEFLKGIQVVCLVSVVGLIAGTLTQRTGEAWFWSVVGAMSAFLCAVGEPLTHELFQYAWPLVGAATAASAVLLDRYSLASRMVVGALLGAAILGLFAFLPSRAGATNAWTEVACGPVAGAIMVGLVWVLETLRVWRHYSRSVLILSLAAGVVGGNVFGRWIGVL